MDPPMELLSNCCIGTPAVVHHAVINVLQASCRSQTTNVCARGEFSYQMMNTSVKTVNQHTHFIVDWVS